MSSLPLFVPRRKQRGVIERYLDGQVVVTEMSIAIEACELDLPRGVRRFRHYTSGQGYVVVQGIAHLTWRGEDGRALCAEDQASKNGTRADGSRWSDILDLAKAIRDGAELPLAALVHPTLHEYEGLLIIDGARRIVAHVEAGADSFVVAVIKRDGSRRQNNAMQAYARTSPR